MAEAAIMASVHMQARIAHSFLFILSSPTSHRHSGERRRYNTIC
jgi:hypothetical protein